MFSEPIFKNRKVSLWMIVQFCVLQSACGGGELDFTLTQQPQISQPTPAPAFYYDYTPPNLVLSLRDGSGETPQPQASSAEMLLASDEPLSVAPDGRPLGNFTMVIFGGLVASYDVSFADSTKMLIRIRLFVLDASTYQMKFAVPDVYGNWTAGEIMFTTKSNAPPSSQNPPILTAEIFAPTFVLQNGYWIPSGTNVISGSTISQNGYNPTPYPTAASNGPNGMPVYVPPLILERVRGPNYTWISQYKYQTPCPVGYYCPPVESVAPQAPLNPTPNLSGIGGELIKLCWEFDCGTQIAESLLRRGIKGFFVRPIRK